MGVLCQTRHGLVIRGSGVILPQIVTQLGSDSVVAAASLSCTSFVPLILIVASQPCVSVVTSNMVACC